MELRLHEKAKAKWDSLFFSRYFRFEREYLGQTHCTTEPEPPKCNRLFVNQDSDGFSQKTWYAGLLSNFTA